MDKVIRNTTFPRSLNPSQLDFFSEGVGIRVRGSDKAKNYFGIFLTLLAYAALGGAGWWYTMEFFDEKSPKVVVQHSIQNQANKFKVGSMGTRFFFLIGNPQAAMTVTDRTATPTDPSVSASADSTASPFASAASSVTGTTNPYLSADQVGSYFNVQVVKEVVGFVSDPATGADSVSGDFVGYSLTPCSTASWFTAANTQSRLQQNQYMYALVQKYGLCLDLPADTEIFGDSLSKSYASIRVSLGVCDSAASAQCLANAAVAIGAAPRLKMDFGAFEPVLEDQKKSSALRYSLNLKNTADISLLTQASIEVSLKKVEVETDNGWVWPDTSISSVAAVDSISRSYSPSFIWGPDITSIIIPAPATSPNYVVQFKGPQADLVSISIGSSRVLQSIKKVYPNIPDSAAKIGGSVELFILVLLFLFHWTENLFTNSIVKGAAKAGLKIPDSVCSSKYSVPSSQVFDELSEEAISLESMVCLGSSQKFVMEATMSPEAKALLPLAVFMKKSVQKKQAKIAKASPPANTTPVPALKQQVPTTILVGEGSKESPVKLLSQPVQQQMIAPELTRKDAYDRLSKPEQMMSRPTTMLEQQIVDTIHQFCNLYGVNDIQELFKTGSAPKAGPSQITPAANSQTPARGPNQNQNDLDGSVNLMNQTASETAPLSGPPAPYPNSVLQKPESVAIKPAPTIVVSPPSRSAPMNLGSLNQVPPVGAEGSKRVTFSENPNRNGNIKIMNASNPQPTGNESPTYTRESPQAERSANPPQVTSPNSRLISRFDGSRPLPQTSEASQEIPGSSENRGNLNSTAPSRELPQGETTRVVQPRSSWRDNTYNAGEQPQQYSPTNRPRVFRTRAFYEAEAKKGTYQS